MHLITSILESRVSDPYARLYMRDEILGYLVPDYRPIYNSVVRDLNWILPELSEGMIGGMLEIQGIEGTDDLYEYLPPRSFWSDFHDVLRQIYPKTRLRPRFYVK